MTGDVPDWVKTMGAARREWWARLDPAEEAAARATIQAYRKNKRAKAKQRIEHMRRILAAYNDGMTSDEIGALIGMGARSVREFAARQGVTISRGKRRFRQVCFDAREEEVLRAFALDFGATPTQAVQALVRASLEQDAHPARRLLGVRRRLELAEA